MPSTSSLRFFSFLIVPILITISGCGGKSGGTPVVVPVFDSGLLNDGNFESGNGDWIGNAANAADDNGNQVNSANVATAGDSFDVNLSQVVAITQGKRYTLSFKAKTDNARTMLAGIGLNESPWTNTTQSVSLTPVWQTFTLTLDASNFGLANSRVLFDMGADVGLVLIDDVSLVEEGDIPAPPSGVEPTTASPSPAQASTDVISIYSDSYTNISDVNTNPDWGQGTVTTEESIASNNVLKMSGLNYQGIDFDGNRQNVSCLSTLHVDYWTADATQFDVYAIGNLGEAPYNTTVITGSWQSLDIPLSTYSSVGLTEARQFKFVGDGTVYIDNLYFYNTAGAGNTCGAPPADPVPTDAPVSPTQAAANVDSIYSDAFTDVALSGFPTGWSSASIAEESIAGNNVQKMSGGFIGIEPTAGVDGTSYTHMHIDVWAASGSSILFKIRDYGANGTYDGGDDSEIQFTHTLTVNEAWEGVDIPLSNATKASLSQIVIDAANAGSLIYFDNIYFY